MNDLRCPCCSAAARTGATYPIRCDCGGLWGLSPEAVIPREEGIPTPLWNDPVDDDLVWKREDLNATGSFKDRGAGVLVPYAAGCGARSFVMDSSGSAALAGAAAAARIGIPVTIHTPAGLPAIKAEAVRLLGARLIAEGTRAEAAERAGRAARESFYLSHVYHPVFSAGTASAGREALRQGVPDTWVLPVGNGSLLLGLRTVLNQEARSGVRLIAVQAASCAGLLDPGRGGASSASGIAIDNPPRREEILNAIEETGGRVLAVGEDEIERAWHALWERGVAAEEASAAALAGVIRMRQEGENGPILGWLTGSGLR